MRGCNLLACRQRSDHGIVIPLRRMPGTTSPRVVTSASTFKVGASDGNRTHVSGLGSHSSTIELRSPMTLRQWTPRTGTLFPSGVGGPTYPATSRLAEVCTLSVGATVSSLSRLLLPSLRFLRNPLPAETAAILACGLNYLRSQEPGARSIEFAAFRTSTNNRVARVPSFRRRDSVGIFPSSEGRPASILSLLPALNNRGLCRTLGSRCLH